MIYRTKKVNVQQVFSTDYTWASCKPSLLSVSIEGTSSNSSKTFSADAAAFEASGAKLLASPIAIAPKTTAENTLKLATNMSWVKSNCFQVHIQWVKAQISLHSGPVWSVLLVTLRIIFSIKLHHLFIVQLDFNGPVNTINPCPAESGYTLPLKQCRSRSIGFWRSQLIWICTVCHSLCVYQHSESRTLTGWKLEIGVAS